MKRWLDLVAAMVWLSALECSASGGDGAGGDAGGSSGSNAAGGVGASGGGGNACALCSEFRGF